MTRHTFPAVPRQSSISSTLAVTGLVLVTGSLVAGIVLSTDTLDVPETARTMAWLFPAAIAGVGALLVGVILRFSAVLASLGLRIDAMRDHLPALIHTTEGGK
jgi:hypothetical protein